MAPHAHTPNTTYLRRVRFDEAVTSDFAMALEAGGDSW